MTCGVGNCWDSEEYPPRGWWPANEEFFKWILESMNFTKCTSIEAGDWVVNPAMYGDYGNACYWATPTPACPGSKPGISRFCPCKRPVTTTTTTTVTAPPTPAPGPPPPPPAPGPPPPPAPGP